MDLEKISRDIQTLGKAADRVVKELGKKHEEKSLPRFEYQLLGEAKLAVKAAQRAKGADAKREDF